jgi:hypothetical protein
MIRRANAVYTSGSYILLIKNINIHIIKAKRNFTCAICSDRFCLFIFVHVRHDQTGFDICNLNNFNVIMIFAQVDFLCHVYYFSTNFV